MSRSKLRLAAGALALAGLTMAPAAHATDVAKLPLKASVLAKPNVIFAMDDSGSMDWELLLQSVQGLPWWNGTTAWDGPGKKPLHSSGLQTYGYLFPMGNAAGGQIYAYNAAYGRTLPPINQVAWLRSAAFNPIYYDPAVTYTPWSPAYHDGALRSYGNANPGAALSHPTLAAGPALALNSMWQAGSPNYTNRDGGYTFFYQAGMVVPADAQRISGTCTLGSPVANGNSCYAATPYYPATFWHPEPCAVGADCINAPDGSGTLKRYEIKPGNSFPSGRTYEAEMQNFANWFTYYRKRKLTLAASMGSVMENLSGLRMGVVAFNNRTPVTMRDADSNTPSNNGLEIAGRFYKNGMATGGTPTHDVMKYIAGQFGSNMGVVQYACQRNSMFVVTDGFATDASTGGVPAYDKATYGAAAPYAVTSNGSLADLALAYYTIRLRTDLPAGRVPISSSDAPAADKNPNLHINTYAISLGAEGTIWPTADDPFVTAPAWPALVGQSPVMIDDLWHATLNGRGLMYLAYKPTETVDGIRKVLDDIISQTGAQGGVAVSTVNLARGDNRAYFGTYNPAGWTGDVTAHPINAATGQVDPATELWSAGAKLLARDWGTRVIASASGGGGVGFTAAAVGAVVNPGGIHGDTDQLMDYLRGDRTHEGTLFRTRAGLIGAVINSEPAVDRSKSVLYVQSGEGMLHAIDTTPATAGQELWAFVPRRVLGQIGETAQRGYVFETQLDGSPTVGAGPGGKTLLVAGMGAAGRGFHALDVSTPRGLSEAELAGKFLWEFPAAGDAATQAKVGLALGRARIVKTADDGHVVLVSSGYASDSGRGRLWMLDAMTGGVIHEFDTGVGTAGAGDAGLAQVSAFLEDDGSVRYAYAGDLLGNVWRFDLKDKGAPHRLATLRNGAGQLQPVTAAPELTMIGGKRVVIVGTGRILDIGDFGNNQVQTVYAIADGVTLANARLAMVGQTYNAGADTITDNPVDWTTDRGWYVDLPGGEQANTQPTIAYGAVAFTTNRAGSSDCSASSKLYVLDVLSGSRFPGADFVADEISPTANSSGVTALATTGQKIVGSGQDADGKPWEREIVNTSLIDPAKNAWREARQR